MKNFLLPIAIFLTAALVGWAIRSPKSAPDSDSQPVGLSSGARSRTLSYRDIKGELASVYDSRSADERIYATFNLVNSIPIDDFDRWMDEGWFDSREGFELTLFQRLLEERWQREDPESFVLWCLKEGAKSSKISSGTSSDAAIPVLREWAITDPGRLRKLFAENPNEMIEGQLISGLAKKNPEVALNLLKILSENNAGNTSYHYYQAISDLAGSDPELLENALPDFPNELRNIAEMQISSQRLQKDFDGEFARLLKNPKGSQGLNIIGMSGSLSKENVIKMIGHLDQFPEGWKAQLKRGSYSNLYFSEGGEAWLNADLEGAGFSFEEASRIRMHSASGLAHREPEATLKQIGNFELSDNDRKSLISNVFGSLAYRSPDKIEGYLATLENEQDIETARNSVDAIQKQMEDAQKRKEEREEARAAEESE